MEGVGAEDDEAEDEPRARRALAAELMRACFSDRKACVC